MLSPQCNYECNLAIYKHNVYEAGLERGRHQSDFTVLRLIPELWVLAHNKYRSNT